VTAVDVEFRSARDRDWWEAWILFGIAVIGVGHSVLGVGQLGSPPAVTAALGPPGSEFDS
jgi:hypothetical protein